MNVLQALANTPPDGGWLPPPTAIHPLAPTLANTTGSTTTGDGDDDLDFSKLFAQVYLAGHAFLNNNKYTRLRQRTSWTWN